MLCASSTQQRVTPIMDRISLMLRAMPLKMNMLPVRVHVIACFSTRNHGSRPSCSIAQTMVRCTLSAMLF